MAGVGYNEENWHRDLNVWKSTVWDEKGWEMSERDTVKPSCKVNSCKVYGPPLLPQRWSDLHQHLLKNVIICSVQWEGSEYRVQALNVPKQQLGSGITQGHWTHWADVHYWPSSVPQLDMRNWGPSRMMGWGEGQQGHRELKAEKGGTDYLGDPQAHERNPVPDTWDAMVSKGAGSGWQGEMRRGQDGAIHACTKRTVLHTSKWKPENRAANYKKRPRLVGFFCKGTWRRGAVLCTSLGPALVYWLSHRAYV